MNNNNEEIEKGKLKLKLKYPKEIKFSLKNKLESALKEINLKALNGIEEIKIQGNDKVVFRNENGKRKSYLQVLEKRCIKREYDLKFEKTKLKEKENSLDEEELEIINNYLKDKNLKEKFNKLKVTSFNKDGKLIPGNSFKISYQDTNNVSLHFYKDKNEKIKVDIIDNLLGEGAFGKVKAIFSGDIIEEGGKYVIKNIVKKARKVISKKRMNKNYTEDNINREIDILKNVRGEENIHIYETDKKIIIVDEFYQSMSLKEIKKHVNIFEILESIALELKELGEKKIVHQDLKMDNMIIWYDESKKKVICKFIDFGLSAKIGGKRTVSGNPYTLPPEIFIKNTECISEVDKKKDVYAIGVMFFVILCGYKDIKELLQNLFMETENNYDDIESIQSVIQEGLELLKNEEFLYPKLLKDFGNDNDKFKKCIDMLEVMLNPDPKERSDINKVCDDIKSLKEIFRDLPNDELKKWQKSLKRNKLAKNVIYGVSAVSLVGSVGLMICKAAAVFVLISNPVSIVIAAICFTAMIANYQYFKNKIKGIEKKINTNTKQKKFTIEIENERRKNIDSLKESNIISR